MFVLLLKFEEFPGGGEEYRHIESLVFSSTSWGGHAVLLAGLTSPLPPLRCSTEAARPPLFSLAVGCPWAPRCSPDRFVTPPPTWDPPLQVWAPIQCQILGSWCSLWSQNKCLTSTLMVKFERVEDNSRSGMKWVLQMVEDASPGSLFDLANHFRCGFWYCPSWDYVCVFCLATFAYYAFDLNVFLLSPDK